MHILKLEIIKIYKMYFDFKIYQKEYIEFIIQYILFLLCHYYIKQDIRERYFKAYVFFSIAFTTVLFPFTLLQVNKVTILFSPTF